MQEGELTISDLAYLVDQPVSKIKTMRARGQTACWDAVADADLGDDEGRVWRKYSLIDAVSLACVIDLVSKGLSADVAANAIANCRAAIHDGPHPAGPFRTDIWVGVLLFNEGAAHVGGPLPSVFRSVSQRIASDITDYVGGGGSGLFLVNASNHWRAVMERFNDANR